MKLRIVYLGTPAFSAQVLDYLLDHNVNIVGVVTRIDKPKKRSGLPTPPPVKELILNKAQQIPILQPAKASDPAFIEKLAAIQPDLIICVAYGAIIKEQILAMPKFGCINLHTSLLPNYRGAAPIQRSIIDGAEKTGVSIMKMVKELDAGDVIKSEEIALDENITAGELEQEMFNKGSRLLLKVIEDLESGQDFEAVPQNDSLATYASKITPDDGFVNWNNPAKAVHNKIRGLSPVPGAWCFVKIREKKMRLKLLLSELSSKAPMGPGEILIDDGSFYVSCSNGVIRLLKVQLEGKKPMSASAFLRGFPTEILSFIT